MDEGYMVIALVIPDTTEDFERVTNLGYDWDQINNRTVTLDEVFEVVIPNAKSGQYL